MNLSSYSKIVFILIVFTLEVKGWDSDELEIFDLVEEINENFYTLLGIKQDAKIQEIKRAFRNLSVILHPDKNSAEDANIKFRNLVSVYEVLKDTSKREKYDEVLKNGLPNWRSAVYYYRHVRKMGLTEMSIILFILITFGQYIVGWAVYTEKKRTAEKLLGSKLKKSQKKNKTGAAGENNMLTSIIEQIPTPSIKDTLPFQIVRFIWNLPTTIKTLRAELAEQKRLQEEQIQREKEEEERLEQAKIDYEKAKENRGPRRRKPLFRPPEMTDEDYQLLLNQNNRDNKTIVPKPRPVISGGFWTDDDLTELTRLIKKYPGGTPDRWERIAESMNRPVPEVTHMAAKIKENCYRVVGQQDNGTTVDILPELPKKVKTKGGKLGENISDISNVETSWTQEQQKALESALTKFPKGGVQDRWEKIAKCVQGKTKEECILRYKYLVELVKKQNQKEEQQTESEEQIPKDSEIENKDDENNL